MNMNNKKISISDLILFSLEKFTEAGEIVIETSAGLKLWLSDPSMGIKSDPTNHALSQAIRRLRTRGLIEKERKDERHLVLCLTEAGREFVFLKGGDESHWDGKWRIVVFDIPEDKKVVRNLFRRKLKKWGFVQWQKSVWASKKNITDKLRAFISELGVENWILVIESDNVGKSTKH